MEQHHSHHQHFETANVTRPAGRTDKKKNIYILAVSATLHCLLGCGLGEVAGMVIGTSLHWSNGATMGLALTLGFVFGFAFGMIPLIRSGLGIKKAFRQVLVAEGLSIAVMETVEVLVQVNTSGVMDSHLTDWIFWKGMLLGLTAGFVAAYPVNYWFLKRGFRHH